MQEEKDMEVNGAELVSTTPSDTTPAVEESVSNSGTTANVTVGLNGNAPNQKKQDFYDDGRTIARMDVDGMPWMVRHNYKTVPEMTEQERMTKKEARKMMWSSLLAALLVGGVFVAAAALFILFCTNVWLAG